MAPPKTRRGAALAASKPPASDARSLRHAARDEVRGVQDSSLVTLESVTPSKKRKEPVKAAETASSQPVAETSKKKARATLSPEGPPAPPSPRPDPPKRALYTRFDDSGQKYFKSNYGSVFLPSRADVEPFIGQPVWAEHIPRESTGSLAPRSVSSIPIDPDGPQWMTRTNSDLPTWYIVTKAPAQPPSAMYETPTHRRQRYRLPSTSPARPPPPPRHPSPPSSNPFLDASASQLSDATPAPKPVQGSLPAGVVMTPPEGGDYPSWQAALNAAKAHANLHGYDLTIRHSKGKYRRTLYLRCWKGGPLPEERKGKPTHVGDDEESLDTGLEGAGSGSEDGHEDSAMEKASESGCEGDSESESKMKVKKKKEGRSRMVNCPFRLTIRPHPKDREIHTLTIDHGEHEGHTADRHIAIYMGNRLSDEERDLLWEWKVNNPMSTAIHLIEQLNARRKRLGQPLMTKGQIITNYLSKHKAQIAASKMALSTALCELEQDTERGSLHIRKHRGEQDRLDGLFFTHKRMIGLLPSFGDLLGIDATYDISRYSLKLVQFVVKLPWRSFVPVAFGLIESESKASYVWLLDHLKHMRQPEAPVLFNVIITDNDRALRRAIEVVWRDANALLCHWHATQNVFQHCSPLIASHVRAEFKMAWRRILQAEHEGDAAKQWDAFKEENGQGARGAAAIDYIDRCWRGPEEWPFIAACKTKTVRHWGVRTTSAVESSHASLKASMASLPARRKYDLVFVVKHCIKWQAKRLDDASTALGHEKLTTFSQRSDPIFVDVLGKVSHVALAYVKTEADAARSDLRQNHVLTITLAAHRKCTEGLPRPPIELDDEVDLSDCPKDECPLRSTQVLPCRHRLALMFVHDTVRLSLEDFHPCHHLPDSFAGVEHEGGPEGPEYDPPNAKLGTDFVKLVNSGKGGEMDVLPVDHDQRTLAAARAYLDPPTAQYGLSAYDTLLEPLERKKRAAEGHQKHRRMPTGNERATKQLQTHARVHATRCGLCRQPGHNKIQCRKSVEEQERLTKEYNEEKKRERARERQEKQARAEAEHEARREARKEEARRQAEAEGRSLDSDDSYSTDPVGDTGLQDIFDLTQTPVDNSINDRALALAQRADAMRVDSRRLVLPPLSSHGSPAAASPSSCARSPPIIPLPDDKGLDSTLVSRNTAAEAVSEVPGASMFSPTVAQHPPAATLPRFDPDLRSYDHEQQQQLSDFILGLSGEVGERGPPVASDLALATVAPHETEVANSPPRDSQVVQDVVDAAAEALLALNEPALPPVPWPDVDVQVFALSHIKQQRPTEPFGNCAWWALAWHLGLEKPSQARMMLWLHMQNEWARRALPDYTDDEWQALLERIWPGGVFPEDGGASMDGHVGKQYWYSSAMDPIVADMTGAPVCCGSRGGEMSWRTSLPVEIEDLSRPPKDPICFLYSPDHYDYMRLFPDKPLPPVSLALWGFKAPEYAKSPTHLYMHRHYQFYSWGAETELGCPCFWTRTAAQMERPSYPEAPEVVMSSEDEAEKALQPAASQTTSVAVTPSRRSARRVEKAEKAKKEEEERQKERQKEEKEAREQQEAQDAALREMTVKSVKGDGLKLSSAQGAQLFPGASRKTALRQEVKRLKKD